MAKTKEELNELKDEVEALGAKLDGLSEEELSEVTGGVPFIGMVSGTKGVLPIIFASGCGMKKEELVPDDSGEKAGLTLFPEHNVML